MIEDKYIGEEFIDIISVKPTSRRDFIKKTGGAIIVLFTLGDISALEGMEPQRGQRPEDINAYFRIEATGRVTCLVGKVELGQGAITALAQMAADELDVSFESIDMIMGDTDICPWDSGTWGSQTIRFTGPVLREAAAKTRMVLLELAAEQLKVPIERLTTKNGVIFEESKSDNRITYSQLAKGKIIERRVKGNVDLKKVSEFNIMGKPYLHADSYVKVTGRAKYTGDVRLPGMLYAKILRPPSHDAKLKSVDVSGVKNLEGVTLVQEDDLIAVLHKNPDEAEAALSKIKAQYDRPEAQFDDKTIHEHLLNSTESRRVVDEEGDINNGEKLADISTEETYYDNYFAHATIETHTALANIEGDKATVWVSTQGPFSIMGQIAEAIGFPSENVRVITPFVGGGFGGKSPGRQALEAAKLAKITKKPVQVAWTRAEEFFYDTYRPAAVIKIKSGTTKSGDITFFDYNVYYAGTRGAGLFYEIPNHVVASYSGRSAHPFATGAWRAPGNSTNTFARESQIDIMASKAGIDPVEFRLKHIKDKRVRDALEAAADKFGWSPNKSPSGRGWGVAMGTDVGSYVAHIAEVEVDRNTGRVQVKRVVCAQEMGIVINPQGATIQIEGCINMGLGYALTEELHFKGGEILDTNFDTYEITRFSMTPKIETVIVDNKETSPQGGGEPGIICMGGVIANAVYDAIGARVFQLPITPERILEAIKRG